VKSVTAIATRKPAASRSPWNRDRDWIATLAEPYLRGYAPIPEISPSLSGYRFLAPGFSSWQRNRPSAGFFLGFLGPAREFTFLRPRPPECLVFCWVGPAGGTFHRRLVQAPESLMRRTVEYIRWLTHRPPRFEFFPEEQIVLVRHAPMGDWPADKLDHLSKNFFIETLCWLVRSGLVRRLAAEGKATPRIDPHRTAASQLAY
jgi:hypothetical protein